MRKAGNKHISGIKPKWPEYRTLFPHLNPQVELALQILPDVLQDVWPMNTAHRARLPQDIIELSAILTQERSLLAHSYWERPGFISAYLYYFLPWNIIRQCRLFQGLALPPVRQGLPQIVLDGGSGCLAVPIALWLARPDLRKADIRIIGYDKTRRPLELGRKIYITLMERFQEKGWPVTIIKSSFENAHREIGVSAAQIWLYTVANLLNEFMGQKRKNSRQFSSADFMAEEEEKDSRFNDFLDALEPFLAEGAAFLAIEPGTRLGGSTLMAFRALALERNYFAHAPCTHQNECPFLARGSGKRRGHSSLNDAWCHFTFDVSGAPEWLAELSRKAALDKKSLSLSLLMLSDKKTREQHKGEELPCRVISRPFAVPEVSRHCRYGCEKRGLALLPDAAGLPSGALLPVAIANPPEIDKKSGAMLARP